MPTCKPRRRFLPRRERRGLRAAIMVKKKRLQALCPGQNSTVFIARRVPTFLEVNL